MKKILVFLLLFISCACYAQLPKRYYLKTGGGSTDTALVKALISDSLATVIDSLKISNDSVYAQKGNSFIFQYKVTGGGGGGITLAQLNDSLAGRVPYTGATGNVNLGNNRLDVNNIRVTGTGGTGDIHLRHQSSDATATVNSTSLFSDINGNLKIKNDGGHYSTFKVSEQTADRVYSYQNKTYTLGDSAEIAVKLNISDTATMLSPYLRSNVASATYATILTVNGKLSISDTASMLSPYLRKIDTLSLSNRINLKNNISDTASMLSPYLRKNQYQDSSILNSNSFFLLSDVNTSSTSAVNTGLKFPATANTSYRIIISGKASKATSVSGMKVAINGPSGSTIKANQSAGTTAYSGAMSNSPITTIGALAGTFATGTGVEVPFRIEGVVTTSSTSGDIELQFATVTSNVATIYAGTSIQFIRSTGL